VCTQSDIIHLIACGIRDFTFTYRHKSVTRQFSHRRQRRLIVPKISLRAVSLRENAVNHEIYLLERAQRSHTSHFTLDICTASLLRPRCSYGAQNVAVERSRRAHNAQTLTPLIKLGCFTYVYCIVEIIVTFLFEVIAQRAF